MLSYATSMPNTKSAKKAIRASLKKRQHNRYWKSRIRASTKSLEENLGNSKADADILNKELTALQKVLDKAAKNKVIHKNKANRLKSRYAKKITALIKGKDTQNKKAEKAIEKKSTSGSKSA